MSDTKLSALPAVTLPALTDLIYGEQGGTSLAYLLSNLGGAILPGFVGHRLTLQTATPVPTSDQIGVAVLYATPYLHEGLPIYDGSRVVLFQQPEFSLTAAGLVNANNYDAVAYIKAGVPHLDLMPAWTNNTTRSAAIARFLGYWTNSGTFTSVIAGDSVTANKATYLGTVRATGAATLEDSAANRFVWNNFNQVPRTLFVSDGTQNSYNTNTTRQWRNGVGGPWQVNFVIGLAGVLVDGNLNMELQTTDTTSFPAGSCQLDSTTTEDANVWLTGATMDNWLSHRTAYLPGIGYHFISANQRGAAGANSFFNKFDLRFTLMG